MFGKHIISLFLSPVHAERDALCFRASHGGAGTGEAFLEAFVRHFLQEFLHVRKRHLLLHLGNDLLLLLRGQVLQGLGVHDLMAVSASKKVLKKCKF